MKYFLSILLVGTLSIMSCNNSSKSTPTTSDTANVMSANNINDEAQPINETNAIDEAEGFIPFVQNISAKDVSVIQRSKASITFLDVRTPEETSAGIIEGAILLDYKADDFKDKLGELDRVESYIVYCASGGRSSMTADMMQQMGFSSIYNLEGGYSAYAASK